MHQLNTDLLISNGNEQAVQMLEQKTYSCLKQREGEGKKGDKWIIKNF